MRRSLTILIVLIAMVAITCTTVQASLFNPFGGMRQIKMLDGIAIIAVCSAQDPTTRMFFWDDGLETPRGSWLNVSWDYLGPDAKSPDRDAWIGISDPCAKYGHEKGSFEGGRVIRQKHAYRMTTWIYVDPRSTESTTSLTFGVKGKGGEKDKTDKLIIPISTMGLEQFVAQYSTVAPSYATPETAVQGQSQPQAQQEQLQQMEQPVQTQPDPPAQYVQPIQPKVYRFNGGKYHIILSGMGEKDVVVDVKNLKGTAKIGSEIVFSRNGNVAVKARITDVQSGSILANVYDSGSNGLQSVDSIKINDEGGSR